MISFCDFKENRKTIDIRILFGLVEKDKEYRKEEEEKQTWNKGKLNDTSLLVHHSDLIDITLFVCDLETYAK